MKDDKQKLILIGGGTVLALAIVAFVVARGSAGEGDTQANVAEFAKSIDATKSNTPSVPADRIALGRSGGKK